MHGAAMAIAHAARSSSHGGAPANDWVAVILVSIASVVIIFAVATTVAGLRPRHQRHGDDDDHDFRDGGAGGGPGPGAPRGPEGDQAWWPEFERQFAAHVAGLRHSTTTSGHEQVAGTSS
jgi:hypothetical protein